MTLLAVIGIIAIIYFLGKWLRQLGAWMENIGGGIKQQGVLYSKEQKEKELAKFRKATKVQQRDDRKKEADEEYIKEVREEIERLT